MQYLLELQLKWTMQTGMEMFTCSKQVRGRILTRRPPNSSSPSIKLNLSHKQWHSQCIKWINLPTKSSRKWSWSTIPTSKKHGSSWKKRRSRPSSWRMLWCSLIRSWVIRERWRCFKLKKFKVWRSIFRVSARRRKAWKHRRRTSNEKCSTLQKSSPSLKWWKKPSKRRRSWTRSSLRLRVRPRMLRKETRTPAITTSKPQWKLSTKSNLNRSRRSVSRLIKCWGTCRRSKPDSCQKWRSMSGRRRT